MENLLKPDFGVLVLTVCNFLLLVYLLKKFAWGPVITALEKREKQIADDKKTAADAREAAQSLKTELENRLDKIADEAAQKMAQTVKAAEAQRDQILQQAQEQSKRLVQQAQEQIQAEKTKALADVREEIAKMSMLAASRVMQKEMDDATDEKIIEQVLNEIKEK